MLELTEKAKEQFAEYFKNREKQPVRVFLNEGG
jgi:Fe-S cluster assembly iron-binding protein IscA